MSMFKAVQRSVYQEINLDDLSHNIKTVRSLCQNPDAAIIGVVKAGAYGHGSINISKHLKDIGVQRLAVATIDEGLHLRRNGITGPIHVFGNIQGYEVEPCLQNGLVPTVSTTDTVKEVARVMNNFIYNEKREDNVPIANGQCNGNDIGSLLPTGTVHIKVDTGMSRYGVQVDDVQEIVRACEDNGLIPEALFTHFANSSGNAEQTQVQLNTFYKAVEPVRSKNIRLHVSNTGAIVNGAVGTDLDFIRPGMCMYGTPSTPIFGKFQKYGIRPISSIKATPVLVKYLPAGRRVGYGFIYESQGELVGTFAAGYTDGIRRKLGSNNQEIQGYVRRDKTGEKCPVIGLLAMDAMTVRLPEKPDTEETFSLMTNDYDMDTSAVGIATKEKTISNEVMIGTTGRNSRVYIKQGCEPIICRALGSTTY